MNEQNKLAEQLKAKKDQQVLNKEQDKLIQESSQKTAVLEAQVKLLQEQLLLKKSDDEEIKLQQQAEKLQKEQAVLEEEANLRKTLSQAFPQQRSAKVDDDEDDQLKPDQMASIMADAVGKALDAQSKLMLSKVGEVIKRTSEAQDNKITGIQQALIKLVAGMSVDQAKSQFKDFDQFAPDIKEILTNTQGLSPEQAYLLAKAQRSIKSPSQREVETERPNEAAGPYSREREESSLSSREAEDANQQPLSSKAVFKNAVDKAISKILAAKQK